MNDEIVLNKAGNTYVGAIASRLATNPLVEIEGERYRATVGHIEPAVKFTPVTPKPALASHGYTLLPLRWGTKAALSAIKSRTIKLIN